MSDTSPRALDGARLPLAAGLVALVVFVPVLAGDFVYDDHRFYAANSSLTEPSVLWRAFVDPAVQTADDTYAGLWRPLRTLLFAAERLLFGLSPSGPHAVSLVLHATGSALVAMLFRRWSGSAIAALLAALLYALHPAQVECVAWISSQGDLLSAALLWSALVLAQRRRGVTAAVLGVLALLAKEQAVVWAPLAFVSALLCGSRVREALRGAAVPAALTIAFVVVRHMLLAEPFQEGGLEGGPAGVGELGGMLAHQVWFLVLPVGDVFDWQMPWPPASVPGTLMLASVATVTLALLSRRRTRHTVSWLLFALVPTLFVQAVIPLNIRTADRFLLFALPALGAAASLAASRWRAIRLPLALGCACFAALSVQAMPTWASDASLWSATAERIPGHWRAEFWLGTASMDEDAVTAAAHLERAARAAPADAKTRFTYAMALEKVVREAPGDDPARTLRRAREEYAAAANRARSGRQENAGSIGPLAALRAIDLTLALGERDAARRVLEKVVDGPPAQIPEYARAHWDAWVAELAEHVAAHLDVADETALAPRVLEWGGAR